MLGLLLQVAIIVEYNWANDTTVAAYQACMKKIGSTQVCQAAQSRGKHVWSNLLFDTDYEFWHVKDGVANPPLPLHTQKKTLPDAAWAVEKVAPQ